jgi:hypothetical protein
MYSIENRAIAAIGPAAEDDWRLDPDTHAKSLPPEARLLQEVLEEPALGAIIARFKKFDAEAIRAQSLYKFEAKGAAIASFLAIAMGALLVLPGYRFMTQQWIDVVGIVQAILVAASFALSLAMGSAKPYVRWRRYRALAESARLKLFQMVMAETEPPGRRHPGYIPLLPLQLEYLRRYLLDSQHTFYSRRGAESLRASKTAGRLRIFALLLLAISAFPVIWELRDKTWVPHTIASAAQLAGQKTPFGQLIFLAITLIGAGLQGLLAAFAVISMDDRNAVRYLVTARYLEDLSGQPLQMARKDAALGSRSTVLGFAESLMRELLAEHREWLALRRATPHLHVLAGLRIPKLPRMLRQTGRRLRRAKLQRSGI